MHNALEPQVCPQETSLLLVKILQPSQDNILFLCKIAMIGREL